MLLGRKDGQTQKMLQGLYVPFVLELPRNAGGRGLREDDICAACLSKVINTNIIIWWKKTKVAVVKGD